MQPTDLFAFVLMPFDDKFDDLYRLGIKEPAATLGIRAERVDEQLFREGILDRIYRQISAADVIVAEMTGQNPNVFYEVGYAHAKEKLCILSTAEADDIPFDLKHMRRMQRDTWAQLKFNAKKVLARSFKGEELKDSYRVCGRSVMRLVTSAGNFDYDLPIDVTVDDIPF